jgi:two-component system NarL family response regulator
LPERADGEGRIRVLIADDHELFRRGLERVFETEPDLEVVGEASDGAEALARATTLEPDVVLMDVRMPELDGIEATQRIRDALDRVKVVMLTGSEDEEDLFAAVRAGANGYLLKDGAINEIADTVRAVARGQSVIAPTMASKLLAEFSLLSRRVDDRNGGVPRLTERELEVLRLVARGMSNKEIAADLVIAQNTVKNHVRNILEKLHLRTRTEAATYAVREKLIG